MTLDYSSISYDIREVDLKNKPTSLKNLSTKATVPVLLLENGTIIDESLDIMKYAIAINDPENIFSLEKQRLIEELIKLNDFDFVILLKQYKYPNNYPGIKLLQVRQEIEERFLYKYEKMLIDQDFLCSTKTLADYAIIPFIRQFAYVDFEWFCTSNYPNVIKWLLNFVDNNHFNNVIMQKYEIWHD
ncbi:MAG: glutathione S-transferase N-terminal domain-containing protein [Rickettsiaceae bacterium]|nr:glutathione S-transferase N-terminal domain-containing protein [Rickettsiaceae bacterium]